MHIREVCLSQIEVGDAQGYSTYNSYTPKVNITINIPVPEVLKFGLVRDVPLKCSPKLQWIFTLSCCSPPKKRQESNNNNLEFFLERRWQVQKMTQLKTLTLKSGRWYTKRLKMLPSFATHPSVVINIEYPENHSQYDQMQECRF